jgi:hypothetical protein
MSAHVIRVRHTAGIAIVAAIVAAAAFTAGPSAARPLAAPAALAKQSCAHRSQAPSNVAGIVVRNLDERFRRICFVVGTHNNQSPIVRFTTRP